MPEECVCNIRATTTGGVQRKYSRKNKSGPENPTRTALGANPDPRDQVCKILSASATAHVHLRPVNPTPVFAITVYVQNQNLMPATGKRLLCKPSANCQVCNPNTNKHKLLSVLRAMTSSTLDGYRAFTVNCCFRLRS